MRLKYKGFGYKVLSVLRYYRARMYYAGRFKCPERSMIGAHCGIHILGDGQIHCADRIIVDDFGMLYAKGRLTIGHRFAMNRYSRIVAHESITIGDHVTIGQFVSILDHDHAFDMEDNQLKLDGYRSAPIKIGSHIWIGDKCTILKGVTIGDNVVIGANTLIHKDVPSNVVVAGHPFKVIKQLVE